MNKNNHDFGISQNMNKNNHDFGICFVFFMKNRIFLGIFSSDKKNILINFLGKILGEDPSLANHIRHWKIYV